MAKLEKIAKHTGFYRDTSSSIIYWRGIINKKQYKKSTYTEKIGDAKRYIDTFKAEVKAGNIKQIKRKKQGIRNPALIDLWNELIKERKESKAESTLKGYRSSWKKMSGFWGEKNVSDVKPSTIIEFENWFMREYPGDVFFNTRKHLGMFISYLVREKHIDHKLSIRDLDKEVINAKYKKKKPFRVYTEKEQSALIQAAPSEMSRTALIIYFDTGMRKMELLSRKWEDVSFKDKIIKIWSDKNKHWRQVPMTKRVYRALENWGQESLKSDYVFPRKSDPSFHMSSQIFDKEWVEAKQIAMLKGRGRIHDIRHTFATKTAKDNWPIPVACTLLDMSPKIYMSVYCHIDEKEIGKWVNQSFNR